MTEASAARSPSQDASGIPIALAALGVLESLMVTLVERGLVHEDDLREAMQGAVDSHLHAEPDMVTAEDHRAAARVIQKLLQGANAVRASARI